MNSKEILSALSLLALAQASAAVIHSETHSITVGSPVTDWDVTSNDPLFDPILLDPGSRRFDFTTFTVSVTGTYTFADTGGGTITGGDTVVGLYSSAFNVADLSSGWLAGNDDTGPGVYPFSLAINLTAGQTYTVVTSPFGLVSDGDPLGNIALQVSGPDGATLTPVPEPESMVIISAAGLLGIAAWRRGTRHK